jgi:hypothetical protein
MDQPVSVNISGNVGSLAIDPDGVKIGMVGATHLNATTHRPDWVLVGTGLFGRDERLVPKSRCHWDGEYVQLPYSRDVIERSPSVAGDHQLTPELLRSVHAYYQLA